MEPQETEHSGRSATVAGLLWTAAVRWLADEGHLEHEVQVLTFINVPGVNVKCKTCDTGTRTFL